MSGKVALIDCLKWVILLVILSKDLVDDPLGVPDLNSNPFRFLGILHTQELAQTHLVERISN